MKSNRKVFLSGFNEEEPLLLHVVSRVVDRQYLFGDEEREMFVEMMQMYADFCEIKILSYCVMSNHFHILLEIPPAMDAVELSDEAFFAKLGSIYSVAYVREIKKMMQKFHKNQATKAMRELKAKYTYRVGNISEFMKTLKQRFSRWYNKLHGRSGTLWEERFSSTAVSAGSAARMVAAYIDLNPLRAGMVNDTMEYRWSSYGAAVAGDKSAREGYAYLYQMSNAPGAAVDDLTVDEVMKRYRILLAEEGEVAAQDASPVQGESKMKRLKKGRGYSREEIDKIIEQEGKLSMAQVLRCKTRYFTDGVAIGSKSFVHGFFKRVKEKLKQEVERKQEASPMRKVDKEDGEDRIYSYRNLQKDIYGK